MYTSNTLASKDLAAMNKIVDEKMIEAKKARGDRFVPLKEALQTILCRPDTDGLISRVLPPVKNELQKMKAWERSISSLTQESIGALSNPKNFQPKVQNSYYVFLQNLMAELHPQVQSGFEKSIFEKIKNSKILLSEELKRERTMHMMQETPDLKTLAAQILTENPTAAPELAAEPAGISPGPSH